MSLLSEIIQGASGDSMSVATLLRKCLVLSSMLESKPLEDWVEWELEGYPKHVPVPDYRHLGLTIMLSGRSMTDSYSGWPVPPELLDEHRSKFLSFEYRDGIPKIERKGGVGGVSFLVENLVAYLSAQDFVRRLGIAVNGARAEASAGSIANIEEIVRTKILKFALSVKKELPGATDGDAAVSSDSVKANQIFNMVFNGPANVVGHSVNSNVVMHIERGDFPSLEAHLLSQGLVGADVEELRKAIGSDGAIVSSFGPSVMSWIERMIAKAADGTWSIGIGAAGALLAEAIAKYYGFK